MTRSESLADEGSGVLPEGITVAIPSHGDGMPTVAVIYGFIPAHEASLTRSSRNTRSSLPPVNSCAESSSHAGPLMRSRFIVASRARGTTSTPPPSHSTEQRRPDALSLHIPLVRKGLSFPRSLNCARNQYVSAFPGGGL